MDVEPGKRVCVIFWTDSRPFHVGDPSGVIVNPGGGFRGLVMSLVSLLVSEMVAQLSTKEDQLSCLAFLMAFWYVDRSFW